MSMQIYFFHSERDSANFAEELSKYHCQMFDQSGNLCQETETALHDDMQNEGHVFRITNSPDSLSIGRAIELKNCAKGNPYSRTYHEGRLYLTKTEENCYDDGMKRIFEGLRKYIRKNYRYCPEYQLYFGPDFFSSIIQKSNILSFTAKLHPLIFQRRLQEIYLYEMSQYAHRRDTHPLARVPENVKKYNIDLRK